MEYDVINTEHQDELVDDVKLQRLKMRVYMMERENYKNKKHNYQLFQFVLVMSFPTNCFLYKMHIYQFL